MKNFTVTALIFVALMGAAPAQEVPLPFSQELEQLKHLSLSEQQVQAFMGLLLSQAPRLMDESADPAQLARELMPQAFQLLEPQQLEFVKSLRLDERVDDLRVMSPQERRQLIFEGIKSLEHYQLQDTMPAGK